MGRPRLQAHCRECGKPCPRRGRWDNGYQCIDCAIRHHQDSVRQINARKGEYYEKWVSGMAAAVERANAVIAAYREDAGSDHLG